MIFMHKETNELFFGRLRFNNSIVFWNENVDMWIIHQSDLSDFEFIGFL